MTLHREANLSVEARAEALFVEHRDRIHRRTDRMFAWLLLGQWAFAIGIAIVFSPYGWRGKVHSVHVHVWSAIFFGALINSLPLILAFRRPGAPVTRYTIAGAQMLWSALLIHLTGGRIETHFHVFGSLAFLAFYRDWRVLVPATLVVVADHFLRGILWPESVYGVVNPEWWRFLEHGFWVAFTNVFLLLSCFQGVHEMREISTRQAREEAYSASERQKSIELDEALVRLRDSQEALVRSEKLAAVGQLAASVGHELRNPLAAVRNAYTYLGRRLRGPGGEDFLASDPRITQMLEIVEREMQSCSKIIVDLLDFARERPPQSAPCPLQPLVEEAIGLVETPDSVDVAVHVPHDLPVPSLDREMFRQVLVNLVQNAVEAIPPGRAGRVEVRAEGGDGEPLKIAVSDDGIGMSADVAERVFQPLFSRKAKGTGLGLAVALSIVGRHGGTIAVDSVEGLGTTFRVQLPPGEAPASERPPTVRVVHAEGGAE